MKYIFYIVFLLLSPACFSQVISNNGAVVSISSGTVINGLGVINTAGTIANSGTITFSSDYNNSGTTNGNGNFNIGGNWINSGTFTAGSGLVTFNGTSAQSIGATTFNNLAISNTSATVSAIGALAINAALTLNASSIFDMGTYALSGSLTSVSGTGTLKTQNTTSTPIPSGKTWTGDVLYNNSSAQTVALGNYTNLNATGGNRTFSSGTTGIAGAFTVGSGTYTVTGSTINFNGSGAQNIPAFTFENITVSGGNTKTVAGNINVSGALTLSANTTLALSSNNITLLSTASATGRVAAVPTTASVTYGTGKFIVQRYIQGRRKYRLMTSSVTTSAGSSLSAGQESLSIWGNWQNQGNTSIANSGTIITGGTTGDGFDQNTTNSSFYTYDEVNHKFTGFTSANGKNTKYTPLKAGTSYYMFVYGDRTNSVTTSTPNYTVLTSSGTIVTGDQTYTTASATPLTNTVGNYTMLGNPYASPIDWATVTKTNLYNTFWGWDPNLSSTGGYVTVSTTGTTTLISPFSGSVGLNQYIQSGQGFFVRTQATSPSLVIKESDKVSNYNSNAFRTTTNDISLIAINLYDGNTLLDGALTAFDNNYSNAIGKEDAEKILGSAETLSIDLNNQLLSINARQMPQQTDTILVKTGKLTKPQYTLQIFTNKMDVNTAKPYLFDKYLNTVKALSVSDTNRIAFNVSSDVASSAADRFKIIFSSSDIATPVAITLPAPEVKVYPNPVRNQKINMVINDLTKGIYKAGLFNQQGQQILSQEFDHTGGTFTQTLGFNSNISKGIYRLTITGNNVRLNKAIIIE